MAQFPDPAFMESININMRVPERLSVGPGPEAGPGPRRSEEEGGGAGRRVPPAYAMHIPDRLTYADTPDMSPRPLFRPASGVPLGLEPCWENVCVEALHRDGLQSPIRRSYSDQSFGRTPPGTPTHLKQALTVPRPPSSWTMESWSPEEEGGAAVEFIILRRQVLKMSRRLAALERHSVEQRSTELLLSSLLLSALLLNAWLWTRR